MSDVRSRGQDQVSADVTATDHVAANVASSLCFQAQTSVHVRECPHQEVFLLMNSGRPRRHPWHTLARAFDPSSLPTDATGGPMRTIATDQSRAMPKTVNIGQNTVIGQVPGEAARSPGPVEDWRWKSEREVGSESERESKNGQGASSCETVRASLSWTTEESASPRSRGARGSACRVHLPPFPAQSSLNRARLIEQGKRLRERERERERETHAGVVTKALMRRESQ